MCGIIGILSKKPAAQDLLDGLKRLEYRGYDSAGIATLVGGKIERRRAEGKLMNLANRLAAEPLPGTVGIGHTRWATHGKPTVSNAHPHASAHVAVVHNGIIENYREIRTELEKKGVKFESETDTETIVHLLTDYVKQGMTPQQATATALKRFHGAFALAILFAGHEDLLIGARRGSPLAVGYGEDEGELFLGSDALALAPLTNKITYLEEGDYVVLQGGKAAIFAANDNPVKRAVMQTALSGALIGKGQYRHYMLKEIFEQPAVIGDTINSLVRTDNQLSLDDVPVDWKKLSRLTITACGTAYYAGMVAKYWFEQIARLPVEIDIASEFRYRESPMMKDGALLVVSQSGETADTLAAMDYARGQGQKLIAVVNVLHSSIARKADAVVPTLAGPEIGVASTKAYTTQLVVLFCLAVAAGLARGVLTQDKAADMLFALREIPELVTKTLHRHDKVQQLAQQLAEARDVLFLARGLLAPVALEGALKMKEVSYIHAEGYPSGELKHGPIALLDEGMPVVMMVPKDGLFDKNQSNLEEVAARGAYVLAIGDQAALMQVTGKSKWTYEIPGCHPILSPILYAVPVQLLAYYTAVAKGTDVDQPRNLAKSVTVE